MTAVPPPATTPPPGGWAPPAPETLVQPAAPADATRVPWVTRREVRAALIVIGVLAVVGVLAGLVWLWWSPSRGIALALGPHSLIPDETENFIAADGRYAVVTAVVGLVAAILCWRWKSVRGPVMAVGLTVGAGVGAGLTALVGRLFGGGVSGAASQKIITPHLELRALGLLALEAAVALLVYGLSVTVSARDDLGFGDPGADPDDRPGAPPPA